MHCEIFDIKLWNINDRCNKLRLSCIWSHFTALVDVCFGRMEIGSTLSLPTASGNFCRLLLVCKQFGIRSVGPDLDLNCLTTRWYS